MKIVILIATFAAFLSACSHNKSQETVNEGEAARLDRKLVRDAVVFESGAKDGAVVPDISAPRLRATWIPERIENGKLIEAHREWNLEGDVAILGIPKEAPKKGARK